SLDHVGPLARSTRDLALAYDAMQGHDEDDPVCAQRPVEEVAPLLARGSEGLRIAVAGGYFRAGASAEARTAVAPGPAALGVRRGGGGRGGEGGGGGAFVVPAREGGAVLLGRLRAGGRGFDPAVRDRLIAGAMIPAAHVVKAQKFRRWYREQVLALFAHVDAV